MELLQARDTALADLGLETVRAWALWLTEVARWLMPHLARREARHHAWASMRGLRSPVERKNGWQLGRVDRERGHCCLFSRSPSEPDRILSHHPALQFPGRSRHRLSASRIPVPPTAREACCPSP